jgi:integrase
VRTSELCALRWRDVDMTARIMRVRFAGGTRERQVPLPQNSIALLQTESLYPIEDIFETETANKSSHPIAGKPGSG